MKRKYQILFFVFLAAVFLCLFLAACTAPPVREDNTARFIAHPEFRAAAKAAPHLMSDVLTTTTRLESELQKATGR